MRDKLKGEIERGKLMCQSVSLSTSKRGHEWAPLVDKLKHARAQHQIYGAFGDPASFPFRDIVIKDPLVTSDALALACEEELEVSLTGSQTLFSCISFKDTALAGGLAFFGHGVFAPVDSAATEHSADLEFSWSDPTDPDNKEMPTKAEIYGAGDTAAAWHTGQRAVAIGFVPETAPATLKLPMGLSVEERKCFEATFLFFGRDARYGKPEIALFPTEEALSLHNKGQGSFATLAIADSKPISDLMDGSWRKLLLSAGEHRLELWCRYRMRVGQSTFIPATRFKAKKRPVLAVCGFVMPRITYSFWGDGPSRWFVHFDAGGNPKYADFTETSVSAVRQSFERLVAFDHRPIQSSQRWVSASIRTDGSTHLPIPGAADLNVLPFPRKVGFIPGKRSDRDKVRNSNEMRARLGQFFDKNGWELVRFLDRRPIAYLDFDGGKFTLSSEPCPETNSLGGANTISIDWLNKFAQVEVDGGVLGVAQHWQNLGSTAHIEREGNGFAISMRRSEQRPLETFKLVQHHYAMLGPLYVTVEPHSEDDD